MSDYKDAIQYIFEDLCDEAGYENYWDAPEAVQHELYGRAMSLYTDRMADHGDMLLDMQREGR